MKFIIFTIFIMIAAAMAAEECSPMYKYCAVSDDCCRHLVCLTYAAKCVPKGGLVVPGEDKRPLGPGPYPPNVPEELLH